MGDAAAIDRRIKLSTFYHHFDNSGKQRRISGGWSWIAAADVVAVYGTCVPDHSHTCKNNILVLCKEPLAKNCCHLPPHDPPKPSIVRY